MSKAGHLVTWQEVDFIVNWIWCTLHYIICAFFPFLSFTLLSLCLSWFPSFCIFFMFQLTVHQHEFSIVDNYNCVCCITNLLIRGLNDSLIWIHRNWAKMLRFNIAYSKYVNLKSCIKLTKSNIKLF